MSMFDGQTTAAAHQSQVMLKQIIEMAGLKGPQHINSFRRDVEDLNRENELQGSSCCSAKHADQAVVLSNPGDEIVMSC